MKARNLLWITVINIFLILMVSVLMEYTDLNSRFKQLANTVSTATDTALFSSTASEEFFSSKFASEMTSHSAGNITGTIKVYSSSGDCWVSGELYKMAHFYNLYNRFPSSQGEYDNSVKDETTSDIYDWLFGGTGSVYNEYSWANSKTKLWNSPKWNDIGTDRTPSPNFKAYYNSIGNSITSEVYVKVKLGSPYDVRLWTIPTLTQMGLALNSVFNGNLKGGSITNDYLSSVTHFGKAYNGIADTLYYLTPYSLGVTYVPIEVFKPAFIAHLDQLVRYESVKHTVTSDSDINDFKSSTGCISTEVYTGGTTNAVHTDTSTKTNIINDGEIEYDLSTVKVKVDYFLVDFYDNANYIIVNRIEGSTSQYNAAGNAVESNSNSLTTLPERLKAKDTSNSATKSGKRIVAKVSVKLKIHIPYKSSILQWFRQMNDTDGSNHYDIRLWDETTNSAQFDSNGLWYYYTTYTAISR